MDAVTPMEERGDRRGAALRHSRDDESEADSLGLGDMDREGLDPGALARFFARMTKRETVKDEKGAAPLSAAAWAIVKAACP